MITLAGVPVANHTCSGMDCQTCVDAEREAAGARLEAYRAKKFDAKTKRGKSVVASARPTGREYRHVAGDVPSRPDYYTRDREGVEEPVARAEFAQRVAAASTLLQQPLTDGVEPFVASPAHLSEATVAKGFILAGNAIFTVRSLKTGVRYTFKVTRADCSRCGKTDCQCWKNPTYFVALLTGPDNQGDYTYLGMLRDGVFKLTRGSKMKADSKPVAAFRYVWERLALARYPEFVEIWHEGRCGRCGRPLTVPESIASGIGPVCAEK